VSKKGGKEKSNASHKIIKKIAASHGATSAADADQRDEAIKWASSTTSEAVLKSSVSDKIATRQKSTKKTPITDSADSIAVQEFVAAQ